MVKQAKGRFNQLLMEELHFPLVTFHYLFPHIFFRYWSLPEPNL